MKDSDCSYSLPFSRSMKLTFLMSFLFVFHAYAEIFGQRISLSVRNTALEQVMTEVRKQSTYNIVFKPGVLDYAKNINVTLVNKGLNEALDLILNQQNIEYTIVGNSIILSHTMKMSSIDYQQIRDVTGTVLNEKREPLVGATVRLVAQNKQVLTKDKGEFSLSQIKGNATLNITYLGYKTRNIQVLESQVNISVVLQVSDEAIDEVTISTGIFKKVDNSFTGASTTISAEQLSLYGNRNLLTSLRNIDPSFVIVENNLSGSNPNQLPDIQIRGNSSLPNIDNLDDLAGLNTPLIILDGFQSTLQRMLDINVNEVEYVTILKDASATAIYGSRSANGVIVITSKLPKEGSLRISYNGQANIEMADLSGYTLLNAREKLDLERQVGLYNMSNNVIEMDVTLKKYYNYLLNEVNAGVNTDWLRAPLHTGAGQRHNLSFNGGNSTFRYSASVQVNNIEGVMKGSGRNMFTGTINLAYQLKNVKFSNQTIIGEGKYKESQYGSFSEYARMNPYFRAYDLDGAVLKNLGDPQDDFYKYRWNTLPTNPLYNGLLNGFDKTRNSELINNTSVEWTVLGGLLFRGQLGLGKTTTQMDIFRPADHTAFTNYSMNNIFRKGDYNYNINNGFNYDGSINLQYSKHFNQLHLLNTGLDLNIRHQQNSMYGFLAEGFASPNVDFISMALQYAEGGKPNGTESVINTLGATGIANYIFDNRYFADVSLRLDGSSQFGVRNRIAPFWSFGLGWNVHNEKFLKDNIIINRLKIRGSTGITGSQNFSAYQALSTYRYYNDRRYFNLNGAYLLGLGNEDLKWQQTLNYNIGFDSEFFGRRLKLIGDVYRSTTRDLVSSISIPGSTGFTSYVENIGNMQNEGFELRATGIFVNQGRMGWYGSISAGVAQNKNKIVRISQALKDAQRNRQMAQEAIPSNLYVEGYSTRTIWVVPSLGIDPSTGKEIYMDLNGEPTYTWTGNNLRAMGNVDPDYRGNLGLILRYKGFTFNTSFGYRFGGQLYNQTLINKVENVDYRYNVDRRVYEDRWQAPGDITQFKGLMVTNTTYKTSRFVQNENTLNCQNILLQYDFSPSLIKKLRMQQLQIRLNVDQPFQVSSIRQERGINYPFSRMYTFGLSTTF